MAAKRTATYPMDITAAASTLSGSCSEVILVAIATVSGSAGNHISSASHDPEVGRDLDRHRQPMRSIRDRLDRDTFLLRIAHDLIEQGFNSGVGPGVNLLS